MNNYEFCAYWVKEQGGGPGIQVLDYGCGAGEIVTLLRGQGIDAHGCDVFYEGGDYSKQLGSDVLGSVIRKMDVSGAIPFEDSRFDLVINNQVMEHVEDLDRVLSEINRVLKPGGKVLSLFPDRGVWREGHCGIPFLHWFPKRSRPRVYYATVWRTLGFGHFKKGKTILKWSEDFCKWLDDWTWYRTTREIEASYGKYFGSLVGIESYWLMLRLNRGRQFAMLFPTAAREFLVRKLAGRVFICAKSSV